MSLLQDIKKKKGEKMKITLTRALVKLKTLDKRINKKTNEGDFVDFQIGGEDQKKATTNSNYTSVIDLITYRAEIKKALVKANAETIVKIDGMEMTIADAIDYKNHTLNQLSNLHYRMTQEYENLQDRVERLNEDAQERLDRLLQANFGKDLKARPDELKVISDQFWESNKATIKNQEAIEKTIRDLWDKIEDFRAEVDLTLSEANARTEIEVPD